jgi:tRNA (guanine6-N2)-methyltransferase
MTIRATTAPGIEDVARDEAARLLAAAGIGVLESSARAFGLPGVVTLAIGPGIPFDRLRRADPLGAARSLFHVAVHIAELDWDGSTLASLVDAVGRVGLDELAEAASFRVSCTRVGEHGFQSPQVEREAGTVLQARYRTPVDLEEYELHVKIDVTGSLALCGYQLTRRKGLDRRHRWVYHPRVTLRTPIAYAMLVLCGYAARPGRLHDPFCGSGTILLEAAGVARDSDRSAGGLPPLSGSDLKRAAVEGARANLAAAGLADVRVHEHDARELGDLLAASSLDFIVTNPPFGIRLGRGSNFHALYREFLAAAARTLRPGGVLALLVGKRRGVFNKVLQGVREFDVTHVRIVEMGGVYAALFVLTRTSASEVVVDCQRQER